MLRFFLIKFSKSVTAEIFICNVSNFVKKSEMALEIDKLSIADLSNFI